MIAKAAGFQVGQPFYEKSVGHAQGIYLLKSIASDGAVLEQHTLCGPALIEAKVKVEALLSGWAPFKGELPATLVSHDGFNPHDSTHYQMELLRARAFQGLMDITAGMDKSSELIFSLYPSEVRAAKAFAKGSLHLVPATDLKGISGRKGPASVPFQVGKETVFLVEPTRPRGNNSAEWKADCVVVGYWWVSTTGEQSDANMELKTHKEKNTNNSVSVLVNKRAVKAHERLLIYQPKKATTALSQATVSKKARIS